MKVSELQSKPPKILLYGPAGRGKTALFLTLGERAQLVDLDDNLEVGLGLHDNLREERLKVDVKQYVDSNPRKSSVLRKAKAKIIDIVNDCNKGNYPFDILGLDSLTSLAAAAQDHVMGNSNRFGENPQIQEWGLILNEIENVIKLLRCLPIPVVVIAHETTFVSDDISQVQIAIPGQKLPGKVTRMFSEIWYMRIKSIGQQKSQIFIQTAPTTAITCRSGRGLANAKKVGVISPGEKTSESVSMWDLFKEIGYEPKEKEETK